MLIILHFTFSLKRAIILYTNDSLESVIVGDVQVKATEFPMMQRKLESVSKWREDIDNV